MCSGSVKVAHFYTLLVGVLFPHLILEASAFPANPKMTRVSVVTGANKGIGFAIAKKLAQAPGHICILTSRDRSRGEQAVQDLKKDGADAIYKQLDIGDPSSVEAFASDIEKDYGRCDILVNNAARAFKASDPTPFKEQATPTLKTNFFDTVAFTEKMLPLVRKSSAGRVVFVASSSGLLSILKSEDLRKQFTSPSLSKDKLSELMKEFEEDVKAERHQDKGWPNTCYGMSKLGVIAYTQVAAREEQESGSGVLVNACCPGYVKTDMSGNSGHLTPEEGARTPFMLTQMRDLSDDGFTGEFFRNEAVAQW